MSKSLIHSFLFLSLLSFSCICKIQLPKLTPEQRKLMEQKMASNPLYQSLKDYQAKLAKVDQILLEAESLMKKKEERKAEYDVFDDQFLFEDEEKEEKERIRKRMADIEELRVQEKKKEEHKERLKALKEMLEKSVQT
eukprot:TRINITY_DN175_c0_g1_i1.p1 TRINITY_DN175_c0_g1~~TRINITY_DN175_c0_g1_i1.p1  ORF type:complete len:138 (-),score=44.97 TRINITY_DN175_c0_g1_i1:129-542(-)